MERFVKIHEKLHHRKTLVAESFFSKVTSLKTYFYGTCLNGTSDNEIKNTVSEYTNFSSQLMHVRSGD